MKTKTSFEVWHSPRIGVLIMMWLKSSRKCCYKINLINKNNAKLKFKASKDAFGCYSKVHAGMFRNYNYMAVQCRLEVGHYI